MLNNKLTGYIKHFLAYALVMLIFITCTSTTKVYANNNLTIKIGDAVTNSDGTYSVPINIENNPGLAGIVFRIDYDPSALQVVSAHSNNSEFGAPIINKNNVGSVNYVYISSSNNTSNGLLFTIKFKSVSSTAKSTELTVTNMDLCNAEYKTITAKAGNNSINIAAGSDASTETSSNSAIESNPAVTPSSGSSENSSQSSSENTNSNPAQTDTQAEAAEDESSANTDGHDSGNSKDDSILIIIGAIVVMCLICGAMGFMVFKKK